jgi:hypothetical protein
MSDTETNPIGTMERLRRCEEALQEAYGVLKFAIEDGFLTDDQIMGLCVDPYGMLHDLRSALTPMTKPEQEGV